MASVQKFSYGTGTALAVRENIPSIAEAPGLAEKALEKYGGLPADAVLERTQQVFMKKYNLKTNTVEEPVPAAHPCHIHPVCQRLSGHGFRDLGLARRGRGTS